MTRISLDALSSPTARGVPAFIACTLLVLVLATGCESKPHAAPARPVAEGADGEVALSWQPVTDAKSYVIRWENRATDTAPFPNVIKDVKETSFVHTGLTNFQSYRYQIFAAAGGGEGPGSVVVTAEPGPVPDTVEWATVVTEGLDQLVYFDEAAGADRYLVYVSGSEAGLAGRRPTATSFETAGSPLRRPTVGINVPLYYRVIGAASTRIGFDGPVAVSTAYALDDYEDLPATAPALADADGDDCLDLVVAEGDCTGTFAAIDLATAGLGGLFATGRSNGDSRFVDVNADGRPDIFSDVLSAADDGASRAILHVNQGDGTWQEDAGVAALGIGGFGGTVLAADFDNDGDVDLFAPHDWTGTDGGRNWLLVNDGAGFTDRAAAAGLATGPAGAAYVPGGGQAVDFNEDGRVDILFGSRLMINNGDGSFSDGSTAAGLTAQADQGLKLIDADLDGDLDLIRHDGSFTRLYRNEAGAFGPAEVLQGDAGYEGAGLTTCDVNGDGFEDVIVASNDIATQAGTPKVLLNVNGSFMSTEIPEETAAGQGDLLAFNDLVACADLDDSGTDDIVMRWNGYRAMVMGPSLTGNLKLRILGSGGDRNQQGRIVKIVPSAAGERTITRVIDSGSGLRSQGAYDLLVGAPWPGEYEISVRFKDGWITATAEPGDRLTIYEDGRVVEGLE